MTQQEREWQHDGSADGDHSGPVYAQGQYDPLNSVLIDPRPWPKLNGAQLMAILFACGVLARVAWWLVTK